MGLPKTGNQGDGHIEPTPADIPDISERSFVQAFPGPALICTGKLDIVVCNHQAVPIAAILAVAEQGKLALVIQQVSVDRAPRLQTVTVGDGDARQVFELTVTRLGISEDHVLVFGKNCTVQRNLTNALISSRQMYKDLVTCAAEFVWETRHDGSFSFISPRGALGYSAAELDGRYARKLLAVQPEAAELNPEPQPFPFDSQEPVDDQEVWLTTKNGMPACMRVSSIPVFDEAGNFTGCRGAGRDVTTRVSHQAELEKLADREKMLAEIIEAIRRELDPDRLFAMAGTRIGDAVHSQRVQIQQLDEAGHLQTVFVQGMSKTERTEIDRQVAGHMPPANDDGDLVFIDTGTWRLIIAPLGYGRNFAGILVIARPATAPDWEPADKTLLRAVSDHLSIAMAQIKSRDNLVRLSRTDELTGLLNRRAFHDDMARRIKHSHRTQQQAALFYIDLDNFKPINDNFGHQKGDELLKSIAGLILENVRAGDLVARLGGDEFACWLEDVSLSEVAEKAKSFKQLCRQVPVHLDLDGYGLGFSIGIALYDPLSNEATESLVNRADGAMYRVKKKGKGDFVIAPSYEREKGSEDAR